MSNAIVRLFDLHTREPGTFTYPPFNYCPRDGTPLFAQRDQYGINRPTCPQCGFVHWGNPTTATDGIVRAENGAVLLVQLKDGHWAIPGGNAEYHESQIDSARREIFEETGLIPEDLILIEAFKLIPPPAARYVNMYVTVGPYRLTHDGKRVDDPEELLAGLRSDASELSGCAFFLPSQLPSMKWPDHERVLTKLFAGHYDPIIEAGTMLSTRR
jgi:8-oxo-dGTP pyrophosphatase MutT (NUDIX family)